MAVPSVSKPAAAPAPSLGPPVVAPQHLSDVPDDWLEGMGSITLESLSLEDQKHLYDAYKAIGDPRIYPYVLAGLRNDILILIHGNPQVFPKEEEAEPKETEKTPIAAAIESFVNMKKGTPEASTMAATGGGVGMLDPNVPLATWVGTPKIRVVTPDGKRVIAWGNTLPTTEDGSKRQEAAVCTAFTEMKLEIDDFMTKEQFNHVMGGNGPPRYNYHTGYYYDYGAYPDGHPSGVLICTDPTLLVAKKPPRPRPQ